MQQGYLIAGRYKVLNTIGEGGMANVYLAEDTFLHRKVAVKSLRLDLRDDKSIQERFRREAISTSELSHPNIVNVLDVGVDNGVQFMVIEYIDGTNLKTYIRENFPIPYQQVVDMMQQILAAVRIAHEHSIVHRDLKPENILVDKFGRVKVSDFGIALALSERSITQTNATLGSVYYMSPEQTRGKKATVKSDIYSLGIILYEMLTKEVPFSGDTAVTVALQHFRSPIPSARQKDPRIPQALENVIFKATTKDPDQRYGSVGEMAEDLSTTLLSTRANEPKFIPMEDRELAETKVISDPIVDDKKPKKKRSKKKIALIIGAILLLLGIIGGVIWADANSKVAVPDVTNLTEKQAKDVITSQGLEIGDVDKKYSSSVEKGHVISSDPGTDARIKKGTDVDIQISRGQKKYELDDYTNEKYSDVAATLRKAGFKVKKKSVYSDTVEKGLIISQNYPDGERLIPNKHTIVLDVSRGINEETTPMPIDDLTGETLSEATAYATEKGYSLSVNYEYSDEVVKDNIIRQDPIGGTKKIKGSIITIYISKGRAPIDDLKGKTKDQANEYASDRGLVLKITEEYSDTVDKDKVISQNPAAGSSSNKGDTLNVVISKGTDPQKDNDSDDNK